jgi:hypothetical protein
MMFWELLFYDKIDIDDTYGSSSIINDTSKSRWLRNARGFTKYL